MRLRNFHNARLGDFQEGHRLLTPIALDRNPCRASGATAAAAASQRGASSPAHRAARKRGRDRVNQTRAAKRDMRLFAAMGSSIDRGTNSSGARVLDADGLATRWLSAIAAGIQGRANRSQKAVSSSVTSHSTSRDRASRRGPRRGAGILVRSRRSDPVGCHAGARQQTLGPLHRLRRHHQGGDALAGRRGPVRPERCSRLSALLGSSAWITSSRLGRSMPRAANIGCDTDPGATVAHRLKRMCPRFPSGSAHRKDLTTAKPRLEKRAVSRLNHRAGYWRRRWRFAPS